MQCIFLSQKKRCFFNSGLIGKLRRPASMILSSVTLCHLLRSLKSFWRISSGFLSGSPSLRKYLFNSVRWLLLLINSSNGTGGVHFHLSPFIILTDRSMVKNITGMDGKMYSGNEFCSYRRVALVTGVADIHTPVLQDNNRRVI